MSHPAFSSMPAPIGHRPAEQIRAEQFPVHPDGTTATLTEASKGLKGIRGIWGLVSYSAIGKRILWIDTITHTPKETA